MDDNTAASLTTLLTNSSSWNLSNDDALLTVMRGVSENFLSRTNQILDKMDKLTLDAASVSVKLETANNSFMLLSNIKFIEARVYDDNEEEDNNKENLTATEETETEDVIITEALRCGTDLVSSAFEKVAINDSETESEDEESEREVYVLQSKNSYHLRSLPHIIGTTEWLNDNKIGLGDEEQEDEVAGDQDTESESEDEVRDDDGKPDLSDYSESENEEKTPTFPVSGPKHDADNELSDGDSVSEFSDDDDELFKPKVQNEPPKVPKVTEDKIDTEDDLAEEEEDDNESPAVTGTKKTSFADELAVKLGGNVASETRNESLDAKKDQKPPVSALKKSTLFDSSDSDDDLFTAKPSLAPPPLPKQANKPKPKLAATEQSSALDIPPVQPGKKSVGEGIKNPPSAETESEAETEVSKDKQNSSSQEPPAKPVFSQKNIFGESSDEDDIFADLKVGVGEKKNEEKKQSFLDGSEGSESDDIFASLGADVRQKKELEEDIKQVKTEEADSSDEDDIFSTSVKEKPSTDTKDELEDSREPEVEIPEKNPAKKKAPVGGVSLFAGFNPGSIFRKKQASSDDEPDEVDNQPTVPAFDSASPDTEKRNDDTVERSSPDSSQSVFEINDSDMLIEKKTEVLTTLTKSRPRVGGQRRPPSRAARKKEAEISIFSDTADGGDEDAGENDVPSHHVDVIKEEEGKEEKPVFKPPVGGVSLFGNMNPKDVLKKKQKTEEVKADGSSEDEKSGNSLFENLLPKKKTVESNTSAINSKSEDFLEEEDDLFAPKSLVDEEAMDEVSSFEPPPMNSTPKKTSLDIFDEDSDDDDLFSDLLVKKTETTSKAPEVRNLFGDDDDDDDEFDDLFSSLIKK